MEGIKQVLAQKYKTGIKYSFEDFVHIIEALRAPDGCPWDRAQTHESLRPCMMEEAAEVLSAIRILRDTGEGENLREELGDVLMQVVLHSQIASEQEIFSLEDVIDEVSTKMIRRHPHVFGDFKEGEPLRDWEEIKQKEKEGKSWIESPLREIPPELPALSRASKVLKKIDRLYQPVASKEDSVLKLEKNVQQLKNLVEKNVEEKEDAEKIVGSMLLEISNIARLYRFSGEQLLTDEIEHMIEAFEPDRRKS